LNLIEQDAVQIIDTSGLPTSYQLSAGGKGIEVLLHLYQGGLVSGDRIFDKNLSNYITSCLYPAMDGAGGGINIQQMMQGTMDFYGDILSQPAVASMMITVPWEMPTGGLMPTTPSCNAAYYGPLDNGAVSISSWIANPINIQNMLNTTCSASGFAITDVNQMAQCTQLIQGYLTQLTGGNVNLDPTQIMQQVY